MSLTSQDLYQIAGLNSDGIAGFQAQTASKRSKGEVFCPAHLRGKRAEDFRAGSFLARQWLAMRRGYAIARRTQRNADFKTEGATSCLLPDAADRHAEQLECLRAVCQTPNTQTAKDEPT